MMNRIGPLSVAVGCAALIAMAPASADVARHQILTLQYDQVDYYLKGDASRAYPQSFTLTLNPCDGTVSGPGLAPPFGDSFTAGAIDGFQISYDSTYVVNGQTNYAVTVDNAMLAKDYSISGQWSDNWSQGPQVGSVFANKPFVTSTAYRNHGDFVSQNPDKNDAAHSCIGMPVVSKK